MWRLMISICVVLVFSAIANAQYQQLGQFDLNLQIQQPLAAPPPPPPPPAPPSSIDLNIQANQAQPNIDLRIGQTPRPRGYYQDVYMHEALLSRIRRFYCPFSPPRYWAIPVGPAVQY